ncbi:MAG: tRNA (cytidine(34)-2'-O)-methyltransferase [Cardiobacteriaceae bacterium]|nr:tRNA (cytidine(34)-2'-O)-methyltransferase [Cardiobacteriaceae bacterium]
MEITLFNPQIPQNTGNIIRLCANTGAKLNIIEPCGFVWEDKKLKRAGLDYAEFAEVRHFANWQEFKKTIGNKDIWALTTKGERNAFSADFREDCILLFGSETAGLSTEIHQEIALENKLRLPMKKYSRSMNLANSVSIILYEALRQNNFPDLA